MAHHFAYDPIGRRVISAFCGVRSIPPDGCNACDVFVWPIDLKTDEKKNKTIVPKPNMILKGNQRNPICRVAVDSKRRTVIGTSWDSRLREWSLETGECLQEIENAADSHSLDLCYDPETRRAFTAIYNWVYVFVWSLEKGKCIKILETSSGGLISGFTCDHKEGIVIIAILDGIEIWSMKTWTRVKTIQPIEIVGYTCLAYDAHNRAVIFADRVNIQIWSIEEGKCLKKITCEHSPYSVMYDSNTRTIMSTYAVGLWVWSPETGECLEKFPLEIEDNGWFGLFTFRGSKILATFGHAMVISRDFEQLATAYDFAFYGEGATSPPALFDVNVLSTIESYFQ